MMTEIEDDVVEMTCMTLKKKFSVTNPEVVVLNNGRYAYRAPCPWEGKNGKPLSAFKFCSAAAYHRHVQRISLVQDEDASDGSIEVA